MPALDRTDKSSQALRSTDRPSRVSPTAIGPIPAASAFRVFPGSDPIWAGLRTETGAGAERIVLNGDYVRLPAVREADLLAVVT